MNTSKSFLFTILSLHIFLLPIFKLHASCGTPENLQVQVSENLITFSWSGTDGADIHAILVRNLQTGKDYKGYSSVGSTFATMTVPPGTYNWRVISACNTALRLTEDVSEWVWGTPFSVSKTNTFIPQAHAGCEQVNIPSTSTVLSALPPQEGTGHWSIISGNGGSFGDISSPTSTFSGVSGETYILRWTVSNDNGSAFSDVLLKFCSLPIQTNAGEDQIDVYKHKTTLNGNIPTDGYGFWSIISGEGGSLSDPFSPNSQFKGKPGITYVLRWTTHQLCGSFSDDVSVKFASVTDIDGNVYGVVSYNDLFFMTENLKTTRYNDGEIITNVKDRNTWNSLTSSAWANYGNVGAFDDKFGKLYNYQTLNTDRICPQGWEMFNNVAWYYLMSYYKETGDYPDAENGIDAYSTGARINGDFEGMGESGYFWVVPKSGGESSTYVRPL